MWLRPLPGSDRSELRCAVISPDHQAILSLFFISTFVFVPIACLPPFFLLLGHRASNLCSLLFAPAEEPCSGFFFLLFFDFSLLFLLWFLRLCFLLPFGHYGIRLFGLAFSPLSCVLIFLDFFFSFRPIYLPHI